MTVHQVLWECHRLALSLAADRFPDGAPAIAIVSWAPVPPGLPLRDVIIAHVADLHALLTERPDLGECWQHREQRERREAAAQRPSVAPQRSPATRPKAAAQPKRGPCACGAAATLLCDAVIGPADATCDASICRACAQSRPLFPGLVSLHVQGRGNVAGEMSYDLCWLHREEDGPVPLSAPPLRVLAGGKT